MHGYSKRSTVIGWLLLLTGSMVLLVAGGCGGGGSRINGFLTIDPQSVSLSPGQTQEFHSGNVELIPENVSWKVQEGDAGGTIEVVQRPDSALDESVTYTAPQTVGMYHVQVTGRYSTGETKTATATVEVK